MIAPPYDSRSRPNLRRLTHRQKSWARGNQGEAGKILDLVRPGQRDSAPLGESETVTLERSAEVAASRLKRLVDICGSAIGLALLAPWFLVIALLVKSDSPGPAFFVQTRIGRNGKPFRLYKFRSMREGNDSAIHRNYVSELIRGESEKLRGQGGSFKIERDPRVTKLGSTLRRTSLDELPQLINVLRGEMSLVGPRPPLQYEVDLYSPYHMRRLEATPGITGFWQVNGRTERNFSEMVDLDVYYIDNWSLWFDIKILFRTIFVVLNRKGAW